jgi:glycosyltransferase involved in cell wall biosynthesis
VSTRPSLAVLVPTYNRQADVTALLRMLATDPDARSAGVTVLVADNASPDGTVDAIRAVQADYPEMPLELHEHGENLGGIANVCWLIENAPEVDYVWVMGDDDLPVPGAVGAVLDALRERPVALLHLPHTFESDGQVKARSTSPERTEYYGSSRDLSRVYHHWVTFLSASVLDRRALVRAMHEVPTTNPWAPHIWYLNAGYDRDCAVLAGPLVRGGMEIAWEAERVEFLTQGLIEAFDEGLGRVMDEREFAQYIDDFYPDVGREPWEHMPIELLIDAFERFPHSRELRGMLFAAARRHSRADALRALDAAARGAGAGEAADALVAAGEELFGSGDSRGAAARFRAALNELPTCAEAWNDLGVALHVLGDPAAADAFGTALLVEPGDSDALANLALLA